MKNGTAYAARLKKAFSRHRATVPKPQIPEPDDSLHRLAVAILGVSCSETTAERAVKRACAIMADWNEMRISSPAELDSAMGGTIPSGLERCRQLITALQSIFDRENRLSLDRLKSLGRREARQYLESLNGVDAFAVASVMLWSLGGHAIPVHDRLLRVFREANLVHPDAGRAEVQAFLERHVSAAEAKEFCLLMDSFSKKKTSKVQRTTRTARKAKVKTRSKNSA